MVNVHRIVNIILIRTIHKERFCQRDKKAWHLYTCSTVSDPISCINYYELLPWSVLRCWNEFSWDTPDVWKESNGVFCCKRSRGNANMKQILKGLCFIFIKFSTNGRWLHHSLGFHLYIFLYDEDVTGSEYIIFINYFVLCQAEKHRWLLKLVFK